MCVEGERGGEMVGALECRTSSAPLAHTACCKLTWALLRALEVAMRGPQLVQAIAEARESGVESATRFQCNRLEANRVG